ncbi:MAG: universal stress protein [Alphaproteobacteria bacterium]|nr:universal stress protein [Alphaproteobacteria bacterium]
MAIRVLLTPLFHSPEDRRALDTAFVLANRFQGHVDALLAQPDPMDTIPMVGEGVSADTIKRLMESAEAVIEQQRQATKAVFVQACTDADIALIESGAMSSGQPSVAWREATGQSEDVMPEKALFSDLVVFAAAWSEMAPALRPTFEALLLKARRPILLAPAEPTDHIGHNVAIAWNGTPEARSALAAAMPFLESAVAVHLLTVASARTDADTLDEASDYLAWHGIGSDAHVIEMSDQPVGAMLMQKARAIGADLLVMGGYGHARLRERILGGVTHHIVNQPELPILLAH